MDTACNSSATAALLTLTAEQRRQAVLQFERGSAVVASGDSRHGIRLLRDCCRIDPGNLLYRQALRRAEKALLGNKPRSSWLTWLLTWRDRVRLRAARRAGRYLEVLHLGEGILLHDPWDIPTQVAMACAAESLGLIDLTVWLLEQARHADPDNPDLNRQLARLYERRGNFTQAQVLWELVRKYAPEDEEAQRKLPLNSASPPDLQEQIQTLRQRLAQSPLQVELYLELARLHREAGQIEATRAVLSEGLAATGNSFSLQIELADLEIDPFRRDLELADKHLRQRPDDATLRNIRQKLWQEVNARELELYRRLTDRFPAQAHYRYELGIRLLQAGQHDQAEQELRPLCGSVLAGLALLALAHGYLARKQLRLAARHFEEAYNALPDDHQTQRIEALYQLACCHAELGELHRAIDRASELIRLEPTRRDAQERLSEWQSQAEAAQAS